MSVTIKRTTRIPTVGYDASRPAEYVDPRGTANIRNMLATVGEMRKRPGGDLLGSSLSERVMGLRELRRADDSFFVRVGLTKIEKFNSISLDWDDIGPGSVLTGSVNDRISFAFPFLSAQRIMVITNGFDAIRKYNGSGNTALLGGSPPKARYAVEFGGFLVLGYVTDVGGTFESRIQWPDVFDPEAWTTGLAGAQDIVEDGTPITGMHVYGNAIAIHKAGGIYLASLVPSLDVFRVDRRTVGIGTAANDTIQNLPNGIQIYLAPDGLHLFNGVSSPLLESPVMEELREVINPGNINKCISSVVREFDEYWVGVPVGSSIIPDTIYKYNYRTGQMYKDGRPNITAMGLYRKTGTETWDDDSASWDSDQTRWDDVTELAQHPVLVTGDSSGVTIEKSSGASDGTAAIDAEWQSKDFSVLDLGDQDESRVVRWTGLTLWAKGNTLFVDYSTNGGETWTNSCSCVLPSSYASNGQEVFFDVVAQRLRIRFRNAVAGETFSFKRFVMHSTPRESLRVA